jgi:superfamily II DNA/RNA helicase
LTDLAERGEVDLSEIGMVVIDEADRMADMGFMPQVRKLLDQIRGERQTMLFSATLDGDAAELTRRYQTNPVAVEAEPIAEAPSNRHVFWSADGADRSDLTAQLVSAHWPAIVFCRTKRGADRLTDKLNRAGVDAAAIHGDRSQAQRERALASFISGHFQALVATDIAARGIHVDNVECVVNFDPPDDEKAYVHRSGRTGRAGASGLVVSLVSASQAGDMKKLQSKLGMPRVIDRPAMSAIATTSTPRVRTARPPAPPETFRPSVRPHVPSNRPARPAGNHSPAPGRGQFGPRRQPVGGGSGKPGRPAPARRPGRG